MQFASEQGRVKYVPVRSLLVYSVVLATLCAHLWVVQRCLLPGLQNQRDAYMIPT